MGIGEDWWGAGGGGVWLGALVTLPAGELGPVLVPHALAVLSGFRPSIPEQLFGPSKTKKKQKTKTTQQQTNKTKTNNNRI